MEQLRFAGGAIPTAVETGILSPSMLVMGAKELLFELFPLFVAAEFEVEFDEELAFPPVAVFWFEFLFKFEFELFPEFASELEAPEVAEDDEVWFWFC